MTRVLLRYTLWRAERWVQRNVILIVWLGALLFSVLFWTAMVSALALTR